jgi:hypothetical protein
MGLLTMFETLPPPLSKMIDELALDPAFGAETAVGLRAALVALDVEADTNPDALAALQALALAAAQAGTPREKFERTADIAACRGKVSVTFSRRTGMTIESRPS